MSIMFRYNTIYCTWHSVAAFPPTFKKKPLPITLYGAMGGNITIPCQPEAAPTPQITWLRNGGEIGSSGGNQVLNNGYLRLVNIPQGGDGIYTCRATNGDGVAESSTNLIVTGRFHVYIVHTFINKLLWSIFFLNKPKHINNHHTKLNRVRNYY